jgi:hypothetical protein
MTMPQRDPRPPMVEWHGRYVPTEVETAMTAALAASRDAVVEMAEVIAKQQKIIEAQRDASILPVLMSLLDVVQELADSVGAPDWADVVKEVFDTHRRELRGV